MPLGELTPGQRAFLDAVVAGGLADQFYLSGGTALSAFHLHHRLSEDLDLFSRRAFSHPTVVALVNATSETEPIPHRIGHRLGFLITVHDERLKVEFVHYDFDWIETPLARYGALRVDGVRDILANKLSAAIERKEPKDYADLYFLLRRAEPGLARGIADCRAKFGWPGLEYLLQTAFLKSASLPAWPETNPAVEASEAARFFRDVARSLIQVEEE